MVEGEPKLSRSIVYYRFGELSGVYQVNCRSELRSASCGIRAVLIVARVGDGYACSECASGPVKSAQVKRY